MLFSPTLGHLAAHRGQCQADPAAAGPPVPVFVRVSATVPSPALEPTDLEPQLAGHHVHRLDDADLAQATAGDDLELADDRDRHLDLPGFLEQLRLPPQLMLPNLQLQPPGFLEKTE